MPKLPITFTDYQRIFRVISTHASAVGNAPERSCILFSLIGASIIQHHYKIPTTTVAGAAFMSSMKRQGRSTHSPHMPTRPPAATGMRFIAGFNVTGTQLTSWRPCF